MKIDEKTSISIGLLITLSGGILWLSTIYANDMTQTKQIERLTLENNEIKGDLKKILSDTYEIKADLRAMKNNKR